MAQPDDNTSTLLHRLFQAPDIAAFLQDDGDFGMLPPFHVFITALCQSDGLVPEQVIRRAAIDRTYGHQLFNGTRRPSRDKVLQLAFGFGLTVEGAQELLKIARKSALYPRIRRDAAILYCLNRGLDIFETQSTLQGLGETMLGGDDRNG